MPKTFLYLSICGKDVCSQLIDIFSHSWSFKIKELLLHCASWFFLEKSNPQFSATERGWSYSLMFPWLKMLQPQTKLPVTSKQSREHLETQCQIIFQWLCVKHPWKHPFIDMRRCLLGRSHKSFMAHLHPCLAHAHRKLTLIIRVST